jgi:hypothetical protein
MLGQASLMGKKKNQKMMEIRGELKTLVHGIRQAQCDLSELRAIGADESSIRQVMVVMEFGGVSCDEFLAVRTGRQMVQLVSKVRGTGLN